MTSTQPVRHILTQANKFTLIIAALGISALPATAGVIANATLTTGACGFSSASSSLFGQTCTESAIPDSPPSNLTLNAISSFGSVTFSNFGPVAPSLSTNLFGVTASFAGGASGAFSGDVPVNYAFSIDASAVCAPVSRLSCVLTGPTAIDLVSWTLVFDLNLPISGGFSHTFTGTGTGAFSGSGVIAGPGSPASIASWDAILTVTVDGLSGNSYVLNIPQGGTLNVNQSTATPEPGTAFGMATGLAALYAWLRRRKNRA